MLTMISVFCALALCLALTSCMSQKANKTDDVSGKKDSINFFTKKNCAWINASKVGSRQYGTVYGKGEKAGELWFNATAGKHESLQWASNYLSLENGDQILFSYKADQGTIFTLDLYWDTTRKQLRPIHHSLGDGKWHEARIPVNGKQVKLICAVSNTNKSGGLKKVIFKDISLVASVKTQIDSDWLKTPILIPEPKYCDFTGETIELVNRLKPGFSVCLNQNEPQLKEIIVKEIAEFLDIPPQSLKTDSSISSSMPTDTILNLCVNEGEYKAPAQAEGYTIHCERKNGKTMITLVGNDKAGLYWAWQTLKQLIKKEDDSISLLAIRIQDWPDKAFRALPICAMEAMKESFAIKFNYMVHTPWLNFNAWLEEKPKCQETILELCDHAVARGGHFTTDPSPYHDCKLTVSNDKDIDKAFRWSEMCLKRGSEFAYIGIDDDGRKKGSFKEADKKAYGDDELMTQAWFIKKMSDRVLSKYPNALFTGLTSCYETTKGIEGYYDRIGVSSKVVMLWTGEQCVTFDYPKHVIDKYEKGIEGRRYAMFDNTPGQYFGMYRRLMMCEKHGAGYGELLKRKKFIGVYSLSSIANQIRKISTYQIAEMLWNAQKYNAEKARQRAIAVVAGNPAAVEPIIRYSEEYLSIATKYPIDKRLPTEQRASFRIKKGYGLNVGTYPLKEEELCRYTIEKKEFANLQRKMKNMALLLKKIKTVCLSEMLIKELEQYQRNMEKIITHIYKNSKPLPVVAPIKKHTFDITKIPGGHAYRNWGNGKIGASLYGEQTSNDNLYTAFEMKTLPAKDVILEIEGQNCDKHIANMRIVLNNHEIYKGKTPFVQNGWTVKKFPIPLKYFKKGRNFLKILNISPSSDYIDHWILISGVNFIF